MSTEIIKAKKITLKSEKSRNSEDYSALESDFQLFKKMEKNASFKNLEETSPVINKKAKDLNIRILNNNTQLASTSKQVNLAYQLEKNGNHYRSTSLNENPSMISSSVEMRNME